MRVDFLKYNTISQVLIAKCDFGLKIILVNDPYKSTKHAQGRLATQNMQLGMQIAVCGLIFSNIK